MTDAVHDSTLNSLRRLHWYHWVVVLLSLVLTLSAWYITSKEVEQKARAQFEFQSEQIIAQVQERMAKYEEALWAGVAALHALPGEASRADWHTFASSLQIGIRFPGINGIGVIHYVPPEKRQAYLAWQRQTMPDYAMYPAHEQPEYWPITYIEPQESNRKAVGLDMAHERNRYTAAMKARETGNANITGPITLVQDTQKTPGFLFYAPWYADDEVMPETYGDNDRRFLGLVYAPFIMYKLMGGTLANTNRQVNFSIRDGEQVLYNELNPYSEDYDPNPLFRHEQTLSLYGRPWHFTVQSSRLFRDQHTQNQPMMILIGGLFIDALLLTLFVVMARANQRAVHYADEVTQDLRLRQSDLETARYHLEARNAELEEANKELDQFAFVASHDLKAPLRGIIQLSGWIKEDIQDQLTPETAEYMRLLQSRTQRLECLLDDLLSYSRAGRKNGEIRTFNVQQRVAELFQLLSPPLGFQLLCHDEIGDITTFSTPFDLVIRNLMGNAIKHHDRAEGMIWVHAWEADSRYHFSVQDDGPGVPPEYHAKVFELFHTLRPRDEVEGTGLGLSIIKKILERYECEFRLESDGVRGTCFTFTWPTPSQITQIQSGQDE